MELNEIKKDLYKSKNMAKLSHYVSGNLYYTVELSDGVYQFPIATVEESLTEEVEFDDSLGTLSINGTKQLAYVKTIQLSSDLGTTTFESEMKGSDLNRWIGKAVTKGEFIKVS
jgi:hypothetical protein